MHILLRHSGLVIALDLSPENPVKAKKKLWIVLRPVHPFDQQETVKLI